MLSNFLQLAHITFIVTLPQINKELKLKIGYILRISKLKDDQGLVSLGFAGLPTFVTDPAS